MIKELSAGAGPLLWRRRRKILNLKGSSRWRDSMKLACILVLIVGVATVSPSTAEGDLWRFNSPMEFTSGSVVNMNHLKIWTINSSTHFTPSLARGVDGGIKLTHNTGRSINMTRGIDRGINLTRGIDTGINRTLFICNIV
jgi:hypothetical protein